jgi:hypothetical protein
MTSKETKCKPQRLIGTQDPKMTTYPSPLLEKMVGCVPPAEWVLWCLVASPIICVLSKGEGSWLAHWGGLVNPLLLDKDWEQEQACSGDNCRRVTVCRDLWAGIVYTAPVRRSPGSSYLSLPPTHVRAHLWASLPYPLQILFLALISHSIHCLQVDSASAFAPTGGCSHLCCSPPPTPTHFHSPPSQAFSGDTGRVSSNSIQHPWLQLLLHTYYHLPLDLLLLRDKDFYFITLFFEGLNSGPTPWATLMARFKIGSRKPFAQAGFEPWSSWSLSPE